MEDPMDVEFRKLLTKSSKLFKQKGSVRFDQVKTPTFAFTIQFPYYLKFDSI